MRPPRQPRYRFTREHLLLLGAVGLFAVGAVWVARDRGGSGCPAKSAWVGALPNLGLPLFYTLLSR